MSCGIDDCGILRAEGQPNQLLVSSPDAQTVSVEEEIPWKCQRLVIGTGRYGSLPVMNEVKLEARRRKVDLLILPTDEAIETLAKKPKGTNAILHMTC